MGQNGAKLGKSQGTQHEFSPFRSRLCAPQTFPFVTDFHARTGWSREQILTLDASKLDDKGVKQALDLETDGAM